MIKITIAYPNKDDGVFNTDYYFQQHMPQSIKALGDALLGVTVEQGLSGFIPNSPPSYIVICHLFFATIDSFLAAFTPHSATIQADLANYTNIEPLIQFSDVKIHHYSQDLPLK